MERWRTEDPCAGVDELARELADGLSLNLMVSDMRVALEFQETVLGADIVYRDASFAILRLADSVLMLHIDTTYDAHPLRARLQSGGLRGTGCEIRLKGVDPDEMERRARDVGVDVIEPTQDKPHGLRECFVADPDGYVWVPCVLKAPAST